MENQARGFFEVLTAQRLRLALTYACAHALVVWASGALLAAPGCWPVMWLPSALLGAVLASIRVDRWLLLMVVAVLVETATTTLTGAPARTAMLHHLSLAVVSAFEALVGARLFVGVIAQRRPPPTERLVVGLFAISATILCGAALRAWLAVQFEQQQFIAAFLSVWAAPLLGALVAAPLIITLGFNVQGFIGHSDGGRLELFATAAAAVAVAVASFAQPVLPNGLSVHYGLFPVLLWLAVRYRPRTTFLVASGVALLVATLHVRGGGPFTSPGNALADRTLGVQIFLGMLLIATTVLTVSRHEYRLLQEKLQESTRRLYSAEDAGRRAVAIHLHDGIGQTLIALGLEVTQVRRSGDVGDALAPELDECNRLIGLAHRATRRLLAELQPPGLVDLGLVAAIEGLIDRIRQRGRLQIELHCSGQVDPMSMQRRLLLYRCARELLANVAQHARADRASVDLRASDEQLELIVRDRGTGWDPQLWQRNYLSGKSGLFGLKDQIELLGGRMHVDAAPGQGCSVQIVLPRESG